jgi:hypothetical protein
MDRRRDDRNSLTKIADWSDEQRFAFRVLRRVRQRPGFVLAAVIVGLAAWLAIALCSTPPERTIWRTFFASRRTAGASA